MKVKAEKLIKARKDIERTEIAKKKLIKNNKQQVAVKEFQKDGPNPIKFVE